MSGAAYLFLAMIVYFIPSIVAGGNEHRNGGAIFALNLLLGWTFIGWVAALVWSLTAGPALIDAPKQWDGE